MLPFVKKFDFRGIYNSEIFDNDAFRLGLALNKTLSPKKILVGWDTRLSSKNLAMAFFQAFKDKEVEIYYIDKSPIDFITSASVASGFDLSVMFTGSHNPWDWTGLLIHTKNGSSLQGNLVDDVINNYKLLSSINYEPERIALSNFINYQNDAEEIISHKINQLIHLDQIREMEIVVDIGDGSGSKSIDLLEKLVPQVKITRLCDRKIYDENTPHVADPSNIKNMSHLTELVLRDNYSCGFAFDSDADRVLAVDEKGNYINGSMLGSVHIEAFRELKLPDKIFGYAVDCGASVLNAVDTLSSKENKKLIAKSIPVGRSIARKLIRDGKIDLGIENVGHFYSKDFFMTDSGLFSLIIVLYWVSKNGTLSAIRDKFPDGERGEIFTKVLNEDKVNKILDIILSHFDGNFDVKKIAIDGIRLEVFQNGKLIAWFAIRNSGYEQITKCYFGSTIKEHYDFLLKEFKSLTVA